MSGPRVDGWDPSSAGAGVSVDLATVRAVCETTHALTSGAWSSGVVGAGVTVGFTGGLVLSIPAGVENARATLSAEDATAAGSSGSVAFRLAADATNNSAWQVLSLLVGSAAEGVELLITGAGSIDFGHRDAGTFTGVGAGRGGNADVREAMAAGELVAVVRRGVGVASVDLFRAATIAATSGAAPFATLVTTNTELLRRRGQRLAFEARTVGPVGTVTLRVAELVSTVGPRL